MTREEALKQFMMNQMSNRSEDLGFYLLGEIYDDFESRTCENCKWYGAEHEHIAHPNYKTCINVDSFTYMNEPHFTDGCNQWETATVSTDTKSLEQD